ncbi:hypothetical protein CPB86DRAFT_586650 [Serendipita vermifera]|nr:hypothetical protein CPB86DRAFT_586650 [Serendipita vermifera]
MSSYEDLFGMASSVFDTLRSVQWRDPRQWELDSILDPFTEQILLKFTHPQKIVASPTLAAPTNIRHFLRNCTELSYEPTHLYTFAAFLIVVPILSTFLVAWFSNLNVALGLKRYIPVWHESFPSPLSVCIVMITIFGNIPLVFFFPAYKDLVQPPQYVGLGHYEGVMARVLRLLAGFELLKLVLDLLSEAIRIACSTPDRPRSLGPRVITAWLLRIAVFSLRYWFTRVSTYTATSHVESGRIEWVWRKAVMRTDIIHQSVEEYYDDVVIWMAYFMVVFIISATMVSYVYTSKEEESEWRHAKPGRELIPYLSVPAEPVHSQPGQVTKQYSSSGCQTDVNAEDWVLKSSIEADAERIAEIDAVIESDLKNIMKEQASYIKIAKKRAEEMRTGISEWNKTHDSFLTHINSLAQIKTTIQQHENEVMEEKDFAKSVAQTIKRLEQRVKDCNRMHEEQLRKKEQLYQSQVDGLLSKITSLEAQATELLEASNNGKDAPELESKPGPRKPGTQPVSANTPVLSQKYPEAITSKEHTEKFKSDDSSLLSPPNTDVHSEGSSSGERKDVAEVSTHHPTKKEILVTTSSTLQMDNSNDRNAANYKHPLLEATGSSTGVSGEQPTNTSEESVSSQAITPSPKECLTLDTSSTIVKSSEESPVVSKSEKTSDSELDATNASVGSDNECFEDIGDDVWSRVLKFRFVQDEFNHPATDSRRHFTYQEMQIIRKLITDFTLATTDESKRAEAQKLFDSIFPSPNEIKFSPSQKFFPVFLDIAETTKPRSKERVFTELPPHAYGYACGIKPPSIGLSNHTHRGRSWSAYINTILRSKMENRLENMPEGEGKQALELEMKRFSEAMTRYLGKRDEILERELTSSGTNISWDYNLVARRLLENLGLLPFREKSTEGTDILPPPPLSLIVETPCAPSESSTCAPQEKPPVTSPARPTPTKAAPIDWRQEALADKAQQKSGQQEEQRNSSQSPAKTHNKRKSHGGRGKHRNGNA